MRLPNAPLLEVVFELRWRVVNTGDVFGYDPGFVPFAASFQKKMAEIGFKTQELMAAPGPSLVNQVVWRYRKDEAFPLFQIGHGIFACNSSTEYEWSAFQQIIRDGVDYVLASYPDSPATPIIPTRLELRYVDVFNQTLLGSLSWLDFLAKSTTVRFERSKYIDEISVSGSDRANLSIQYELKDKNLGRLELQIGNGDAAGAPGLILTNRVVQETFPEEASERALLRQSVHQWADAAHAITSNFFKSFIDDSLMKRFKKAST